MALAVPMAPYWRVVVTALTRELSAPLGCSGAAAHWAIEVVAGSQHAAAPARTRGIGAVVSRMGMPVILRICHRDDAPASHAHHVPGLRSRLAPGSSACTLAVC